MSSRAAGGRKRQLKPLQEPQVQKVPEPPTSKSRGFFSRSKPTTTPALPTPRSTPSPVATFHPTAAAYPSSPPSVPSRLFEVTNSYNAPPQYLDPRPPPPIPSKTTPSYQQQQRSLTLNQPRAHQSRALMAQEPSVKKFADDQTQIPPTMTTTHHPVQGRSTHNATYHSPFPTYPQPYSHSQHQGPSPFYSEALVPEADPFGRAPPSARSPSYPTTQDRPTPQSYAENNQRGQQPPPAFYHPGHHQVFRDSDTSDAGPPSGYPSPTGSNQLLSPSLRQWTSSPLSPNDPEAARGGGGGGGYPPPTHKTTLPLPHHTRTPPFPPPPEFLPPDTRSRSGRMGNTLAPSIASASTTSLHSSVSLYPASSSKEGFVFPGSRSTGRPKVSSKTGTPRKFKLQAKVKKLTGGGDADADGAGEHSAYPYSHSSTSLDRSLSSTRSEPSIFNAPAYSARSRTDSRVTIRTTSSSISSSTNQSSAQGFDDHSPHSYAYQGRGPPPPPPLGGNKGGGVVEANAESNNNGKSKFRGLTIWSKKKREDNNASPSGGDRSVAGASIESLVKTLHELGLPSEEVVVGGTTNRDRSGGGGGSIRSGKVREEHGFGMGHSVPWPSPPPIPVANLGEVRKQVRGRGTGRLYPLDPYDSVLLDSDRHTSELLRKLNRTNAPSFHSYGKLPPRSVLDLGCGQGHWVLDAAIKWKDYGTRITGFDMVDVMKRTRARAVTHGVADNITFVRGNFLEEGLPFPDGTFDFIRMSCLTFCIPSDSWEMVLREVFRVLTLGGRLELIDDHVFFPYGKAPPPPDVLPPPSAARMSPLVPQRRTSDQVSTYSAYSTGTSETGATNPSLELALSEDESASGGAHGPYGSLEWAGVNRGGMRDDDDQTDTATLHDAIQEKKRPSTSQGVSPSTLQSLTVNEWNQQQATSEQLEVLFEHLMVQKYGVHVNPSSFILVMLKKTFGHAGEIATMHLTLAPSSRGNSYESQAATGVFGDCPGLMLWPSTLLPMSPAEIEVHASKHLRTLLSCKTNLVKHAVEATDDEEIDEGSVSEAVWEYENFLLQRFYPPRGAGAQIQDGRSSTTQERRPKHPQKSTPSSRMSVVSEISVSAESQDAMWEYQQHLCQHLAWAGDTPDDRDTPSRLSASSGTKRLASPSPRPTNNNRNAVPPRAVTTAPPYSHTERTHIRTFRVFEAIKLNEMTLGPPSYSAS